MKLKVLQNFTDQNDRSIKYKAGQIIEIADHKRAAQLVTREICDFVDEPEQEPEQEPAPEPADKNAKGKKGKGSKKGPDKDPDEGAAGDAPKAGAESDGDGVQNPDQE